MKTSELVGAQLDWAVAKCEGNTFAGDFPHLLSSGFRPPQFSTDWAVGGPIIEREKLDLRWIGVTNCRAASNEIDEYSYQGFGPTPLIAAMRCYVISKLGDTADVPEELK